MIETPVEVQMKAIVAMRMEVQLKAIVAPATVEVQIDESSLVAT